MGEMGDYWRDVKAHRKVVKENKEKRERERRQKEQEQLNPEEQNGDEQNGPNINTKPKRNRNRRRNKAQKIKAQKEQRQREEEEQQPQEQQEQEVPQAADPDTKSERNRKRNRRNREKAAARRCWDWMCTSGNVHYARDRRIFRTYIPNKMTARDTMFGGEHGMEIAGFGTVILKTRRSPDSDEYNMLVLNNVVHMPRAICNGFSSGIWTGLLEYGRGAQLVGYVDQLDKLRKKPAFYTVPHKGLAKLALAGDPQGKDYIGNDMVLSLSVRLAEEDMRALFGF